MYDLQTSVLTPDAKHPTDPHRNEAGQYIKGNTASPGRRKRSEEQALLAVLDESLPAEKFKEHMDLAIAWAIEYKSPKLLMQLWQFRFSYTIGQPVQRSVTASTKLDTFLDAVRGLSDDEFSQVIDATTGDG